MGYAPPPLPGQRRPPATIWEAGQVIGATVFAIAVILLAMRWAG